MKTTLFGHWLREHRKERGWSQSALAERLDVDRTYISKIENGSIATPGEDTRRKVHEVFGTSDDDLVQAGILRSFTVPGFATSYTSSHAGAQHPDANQAGLGATYARLEPYLMELDEVDIDAVVGLAELLARASRQRREHHVPSPPAPALPSDERPPTMLRPVQDADDRET